LRENGLRIRTQPRSNYPKKYSLLSVNEKFLLNDEKWKIEKYFPNKVSVEIQKFQGNIFEVGRSKFQNFQYFLPFLKSFSNSMADLVKKI
jgi:hypothetical protein